MQVVIIGGGVIGISTAFHLASKGADVTVLERNRDCAAEASSANGSQLSYTYAEPLASPGLLRRLAKWSVFASSSPLANHDRFNPTLWRWQIDLVSNARIGCYNANRSALLALALRSRAVLRSMLEEHPIDFSYSETGKLHVYSEKRLLDHAQTFARLVEDTHGIALDIVSADGCAEREPILRRRQGPLVGGMFSPIDATGDCRAFTSWLAGWLTKQKLATIRYDTPVRRLRSKGDFIEAVETSCGEVRADAYVLAAGFSSQRLAREINLNLRIYPIKGYALTLPANGTCPLPRASITDHAQKVVLAPLGGRLRASGLADMDGADATIKPERVARLRQKLTHSFPDIDFGTAAVETGMRPYTPSSVPYIGPTPIKNLFLNTGHGMLGWTLSQGSASLLAEFLTGSPLSIPMAPFLLSR